MFPPESRLKLATGRTTPAVGATMWVARITRGDRGTGAIIAVTGPGCTAGITSAEEARRNLGGHRSFSDKEDVSGVEALAAFSCFLPRTIAGSSWNYFLRCVSPGSAGDRVFENNLLYQLMKWSLPFTQRS